jgi:TFIIH basal transcription factor complex TTD-A subunit
VSFSPGESHRDHKDAPVLFSHPCSDSAVKQILMVMNDKDPFIIEDLDDFHVVIKADEEYRVRSELEAEVRPLPFACF